MLGKVWPALASTSRLETACITVEYRAPDSLGAVSHVAEVSAASFDPDVSNNAIGLAPLAG
ncbi:MAG: hypothetical protein MJE77_38720 [Proteobacteria bacterium]|nr:hypothetical protein [Pseudomonadota bacterium]